MCRDAAQMRRDAVRSPDAWGCLQPDLHGAGGDLQRGGEGITPRLAWQLARVEFLLARGGGGSMHSTPAAASGSTHYYVCLYCP